MESNKSSLDSSPSEEEKSKRPPGRYTVCVKIHIMNGIFRKKPHQIEGMLSEDGRSMTAGEVLRYATERFRAGYEVVPACSNEDARGHCQGHPIDDKEEGSDDDNG